MADLPWTLQPVIYSDRIKTGSDEVKRKYISDLLGVPQCKDVDCEELGGICQAVNLRDWTTGQDWLDDSGFIWLCFIVGEYENIPDVILVDSRNGAVKITEYTDLGLWGNFRNILKSALREAEVMLIIATAFNIGEITAGLSGLAEKFGKKLSEISDLIEPVVDYVQKATAWINRTVELDEIRQIHEVAIGFIPEYKNYWIKQEHKLADMSNRVFGDTTRLSAYVKLLELSYKSFLRSYGEEEASAHKKSLEYGAELTETIHDKLQGYERNPQLVWSDLYEQLLGKQNEFIKDTERLGIAKELEKVKEVTDGIEISIDKINELGEFAEVANTAGLGSVFADIAQSITILNDTYLSQLRPAFNRLNRVVRQNQELAKEIAEKREEERIERKRSYIMSSDPNKLNDNDRKIFTEQSKNIIREALPKVESQYIFEPQSLRKLLYGE